MSRHWPTDPDIRRRLLRVAGLRARGLSGGAIAAQLGVSDATVSRDLRRLERLWNHNALALVDDERLEMLAFLRELRNTLWDAFRQGTDSGARSPELLGLLRSMLPVQRELRHVLADTTRDERWPVHRKRAAARFDPNKLNELAALLDPEELEDLEQEIPVPRDEALAAPAATGT